MSKLKWGGGNLEIPFISLIFQGIPEVVALSILILVVNGDLKEWKKGVVVGVFLAIAVFFIRKLPISFGIHTLIFTLLATIVFKKIFDFNLLILIKTIFLGEVLIFAGEAISFTFLTRVIGYHMSDILNNYFLRVASGLFQILLLLFASYLFYLRNTKKEGSL